MNCAWQSYINILPPSIRLDAQQHQEKLIEIRLRINKPLEFVTVDGSIWSRKIAARLDLDHIINVSSKYSPWAASTIAKGYITAPGGHRIGICGETVIKDGYMSAIQYPTSLSVRVARDFPGISSGTNHMSGSILILGRPGAGKTTFLRDMIRNRSNSNPGCIAVVDERCEIFPYENGIACFECGKRTDILTGCPKTQGICTLLKNMTPQTIAADEITSEEDCRALLDASWCGVKLICTAHAESRKDLLARRIYKPLCDNRLFDWLIIINPDRTWTAERMTQP